MFYNNTYILIPRISLTDYNVQIFIKVFAV